MNKMGFKRLLCWIGLVFWWPPLATKVVGPNHISNPDAALFKKNKLKRDDMICGWLARNQGGAPRSCA